MSNKEDQILEHVTEIRITLTKIQGEVEKNTEDLSEHILRTNLLQDKMRRVEVLLWLGAGAGIAQYGPSVLKLLGVLA
jgi:hypothetical protein